MDQHNIILYSKYSNASTNLIKMINSYHVDLQTILNISLVCVDNESIRKQILNCPKIKINSVPSLLLVLSSGDISLFENNDKILELYEKPGN